MIKREAFAQEYEVRLIYYCSDKNSENCYTYEVNPKEFIEQIRMHSGILDSKFEKMKRVFMSYGFQEKIKKSKIYDRRKKLPEAFYHSD